MKKVILVALVVAGFSGAIFGGNILRVVIPTLTELGSFELRENELAIDDATGALRIHRDGKLLPMYKLQEIYPTIYSFDDSATSYNEVRIGDGILFIGGKVYKNSSEISCQTETAGLGGVVDTDVPPESTMWLYLYLVPDTRVGYEGNFNCVLSPEVSGPVSYNDWKRVLSVKYIPADGFPSTLGPTYGYISREGKTKASSVLVINIPASTAAQAHSISDSIAPTVKIIEGTVEACTLGAGSTVSFDISMNKVSHWIQCAFATPDNFYFPITTPSTLYVENTISGSMQYIMFDIKEVTEDILDSESHDE